jgi:S-DNA-T family DNA segregation ATPase FtsK/SpoIIIE
VGEDALECQLALPRTSLEALPEPPGEPSATPPIRVAMLPADPELPLPGQLTTPGMWLPLGPGGDDGAAVGVDVQRVGGLLVVGPPGSGRSSALRAFAEHCRSAGAAVAELVDAPVAPPRPSPGDRPAGPHLLGRQDPDGLRAWLDTQQGRPVVVVADDLTTLPDAVADVLVAAAGEGGRPAVLGAGTAPDLAGSFRGPAVALRRTRTVLFLRPAAGDAELLGLRTPRTPLPPRPGAGWLVTPTETTRVQVARHRRPPAALEAT